MSTLLLNRSAILQSVESLRLLSEMREWAASAPEASTYFSETVSLHHFGSVQARLPGKLPHIPAYTVSVSSHFSGHAESQSPVVLLFDARQGQLLAVLDGEELERLSRILLHTLAVETMTPEKANQIGILGLDDTSRRQLKSIRLVRSLERVHVFDSDLAKAQHFAAELFTSLSLPTYACSSPEEAVEGAHVVFGADLEKTGLPPNTHEKTLLLLSTHDTPLSSTPHSHVAEFSPSIELLAAWHIYQGAKEIAAFPTWTANE